MTDLIAEDKLDRFAELWKGYHKFDEVDLEDSEKLEFEALKKEILEALEFYSTVQAICNVENPIKEIRELTKKAEKWDKAIQFWMDNGLTKEEAEKFHQDFRKADIEVTHEIYQKNQQLEAKVKNLEQLADKIKTKLFDKQTELLFKEQTYDGIENESHSLHHSWKATLDEIDELKQLIEELK